MDLKLKHYLSKYCGIKELDRVASVHAFGLCVEYFDQHKLKTIHKRIYEFDDLAPQHIMRYWKPETIIIVFVDGGTMITSFSVEIWEEIYHIFR